MININQAIENIVDLQNIFRESFLVYGSALGCIREGTILAHDLDTDIGIMSEDLSWDKVNQAVKAGFDIFSIHGMRHYGLEIKFQRGRVRTDLMVFYHGEEGKIFNCLWDNNGINGMKDEIIHEYPVEVFETFEKNLDGYAVKTLGEKYLEYVYGDWRTPVYNWDWRKDHKCKKIG